MKSTLAKMFGHGSLGAAATIGAAILSQQAIAQDAVTTTAKGSPVESAADESGELVVTAQRRSQSIQRVPLSITAVDAKVIAELNLRNVDALAVVTPGVVLDTAFSFPTFFIRGVGAQNRDGVGLETPVAIYVDGAYNPRNTGTPFDLYDVSSVEVLKGPQGTLYGRNASGGAILIHTADPEFRTGGSLTGEIGNFGHRQVDSVANFKLSDTVALRFAGRYRNDDGFVYNLANGRNVRGRESGDARLKILWEPSANVRNVLSADLTRSTGFALTAAREDAFNGARLIGFREVNSDFTIPEPTRGWGANLNSQISFGALKATNVLSVRHIRSRLSDDNDHSALPLVAINAVWGGTTASDDLQLGSDFGGLFDFLIGASYSHDRANSRLDLYGVAFGSPYVGGTIPAGAITSVQQVTSESYGGFAEGYIRPVSDLTVTLGGRVSHDSRRLLASSPASYSQRYSNTQFTPRAVVAYEAGRFNMYASYTRGYLAGGFTIPSFAPGDILRPEKTNSYEAGVKFQSRDRHTRASLAAFRYNYKDVLVTLCCVASQAITQNAASAVGKGVEFDFNHQFLPGVSVGLGGSYLDAKFRRFPAASVFVPVFGDPANPGTVTTVVTQTADLGGTQLPRAPEWQGYLTISAQHDIGNSWKARIGAVGRYSSSFYFTQGGGGPLRTDRQDGYGIVNLSAGVGPRSDAFEIGAYADNVTGTRYYANRAIGAFGLDSRIAAPRTYGVRVKVNY